MFLQSPSERRQPAVFALMPLLHMFSPDQD